MIFIELHMRSSSEHAHILHGSKPVYELKNAISVDYYTTYVSKCVGFS